MNARPPCRWRGRIAHGLTLSAAMLALTTAAGAAVVVKQSLTGTSKAPNARGRATLVLKRASKGKFAVTAHGLPAGSTFDIVVRGVKAGTLTTNARGAGKAKFRTPSARRRRAGGHSQLLGFDPRGAQVVVRDEQGGDDDLTGDIPDNRDSAAGAFPCCLPDREDGEVECDEMTPTDCTKAGGAPNQAASCLPDPCATTSPPGTVCCIARGGSEDEDPEVECEEDTSAADCAAAKGAVVSADSCDPNPCAATPPPSLVACCVSDREETECELRTPETCASEKGTASGTSCDPNPCSPNGGGDGGGHGGDWTAGR